MKLNSKTRSYFIRFLILGILAGTFAWGILEKLLFIAGSPLDLTLGPLRLDMYLVAIELRVNPGTLLGAFLGYRIFLQA